MAIFNVIILNARTLTFNFRWLILFGTLGFVVVALFGGVSYEIS